MLHDNVPDHGLRPCLLVLLSIAGYFELMKKRKLYSQMVRLIRGFSGVPGLDVIFIRGGCVAQ